MTTIKNLHFKWTISRGSNTSGQNICTLWVDGNRVARTLGGGFDMEGTVLGEWLQKEYQCELHNLMVANGIRRMPNYNSYETGKGTVYCYALPEFHGMTYYVGPDQSSWIILDGGFGFPAMEIIAEAIGIKLKRNPASKRYENHNFYTAIIETKTNFPQMPPDPYHREDEKGAACRLAVAKGF